ncbi:MAG TPA: DUF3772 domain-containing protein [Rhodobacteraceae bacterium]|nr:DUF3772 domain-containing protein [Paracoccaceae bacterium]
MTARALSLLGRLICAAWLALALAAPVAPQEAGGDPAELAPVETEAPAVEPEPSRLTPAQQAYLEQWRATARRAEAAIEADRASVAALEALRREVAGYRDRFTEARADSSSRLDTLQARLDALGPAPEEGEREPADIAALRTEIKERIADLRVPVVVTRENFTRADGIVQEIDRLIRERQTERLFARGETPLNPAHWGQAGEDLLELWGDVYNETRENVSRKVELKLLRETAPVVAVLSVLGVVLLWRGRSWAGRIVDYLRRFGGTGTGVWRFVASLGRILLPLGGVFLLSAAVVISGVLGLRGELVLEEVPYWATILLGFRWLSERVYPKADEDAFISMSAENRTLARRALFGLGIMLMLFDMLALVEEIENISAASRAVMGFPLVLVTSLILMRLRQVIRREAQRRLAADELTEEVRLGLFRFAAILRLVTLGVVIGAPVLAAVGYTALAEMVDVGFILTIALYALLLVLQQFLTDLYGWITGKGAAAVEESIVPFLLGTVLVLLAFPALALIWGARTVELAELWDRFMQGVPIGETRITPVDFLTFLLVFAVGFTLTRMFQGALKNNLLPKTKIDLGGQNAVVSGAGYIGIFLAALIAVATAGIDLSGLAIVAGALSVGIGFGLQTIVSNFVSGIILLIERPISEGDWIEVNGQMGYVRDISVRATRIETFDRTDVIVPNADLVSGQVTNFTRGNTVGRVIVPVGVAYGTDTREVDRILREVAEAHPMVLMTPPPTVVFQGFGASSLDFEIRAILRDVNWVLNVKSEMNHEIARRFAEAGIEIPFPQQDIWLRNPEALNLVGRPIPEEGQGAEHIELSDMDGEGEGNGNG